MNVLEHLEPKKVFQFFEEMCAIPHGSGNTKGVSDWCAAFARERGLEYHQDEHNNIIIIKEATPGYEQATPVILQGHMDMVCQKEAGCLKDMEREGLDLVVEGDFLRAEGTTLGGDNGIAVALTLALLDDDTLAHPRLEAVFTVDEEIGLLGAASIQVTPLQGREMINLDSEDEGVFTVSCAGGTTACCTLPVSRAAFPGVGLALTLDGLAGGHSGLEIQKGRANANLLMGRILYRMAEMCDLRLVRVDGGRKDNAIPSLCQAVVVVNDPQRAEEAARELAAAMGNEYAAADPGLTLSVEPWAGEELPMDGDSTRRAVCLLMCLPNGVQAMSQEIPGLVQTSLNLGILTTEEGTVSASFSVRSALDSQKEMLKQRLACLTGQLGGQASFTGEYTGWQYQEHSPLRERMTQVFRQQYGREPVVEAIHAGLECGVFVGKLPGLDCVSMGPDLREVHTPRERLSISSVERTWRFLVEVLKESK